MNELDVTNPVKKDLTTFVVLFMGRTGSTHLMSMLNNHPEIVANGEILVGHGNSNEQLNRARESLTVGADAKLKAIGFKTKFRDIKNFSAFKDLLYELNTRVIYLTRANIVKWTISKLNAIHLHKNTGEWNLSKDSRRLSPIEIEFEEFDRILGNFPEWISAVDEAIDELDLPKIRISYEELLINRDLTLEKVFSFLGVQILDVKSETRKNTNDDLRKAIKNFEELRDRYKGTPYFDMFNEVLSY